MTGDPDIKVRDVLPYEQIGDRNKKMFEAQKSALLKIKFIDKYNKTHTKYLSNEVGYCYDGATIPFKIGKSNMKLLIPSLWHDIMCDDKSVINYDRNLSSLIFRELLIQCGVNKCISQLMYLAVDNFQRFMKGWKKSGL